MEWSTLIFLPDRAQIIRKKRRKTSKRKRKISSCALSSSIQWGTQLRQRWMPSLPSAHSSVQRKKLLFLGCSVILTPWLLPWGLLPSYDDDKEHLVMGCYTSSTDPNYFVLTNFLSIFALMSLARVKKDCWGKQETHVQQNESSHDVE